MERKHRLVAGLVVIATGVVLLLSNLHIVNTQEIPRYWPILLIAIGLVKLVTRRGSANCTFAGHRPPFADSCEKSSPASH